MHPYLQNQLKHFPHDKPRFVPIEHWEEFCDYPSIFFVRCMLSLAIKNNEVGGDTGLLDVMFIKLPTEKDYLVNGPAVIAETKSILRFIKRYGAPAPMVPIIGTLIQNVDWSANVADWDSKPWKHCTPLPENPLTSELLRCVWGNGEYTDNER